MFISKMITMHFFSGCEWLSWTISETNKENSGYDSEEPGTSSSVSPDFNSKIKSSKVPLKISKKPCINNLLPI